MAFFEDLCFVRFCDEINFENFKKSPRKHQKGGNLENSYSHEKFIQNLDCYTVYMLGLKASSLQCDGTIYFKDQDYS